MNIQIIPLCATLILWLPLKSLAENIPFESCFELAGRHHHIKIDLLMAVAYQESNWKPDARSNANAHGIMQIRWPVTARHLGSKRVAELYNPCLNIDLGARYLRELSEIYEADIDLVLAAYNYGPTRIKRPSDIPDSVWRYINNVKQHRARIAAQLAIPVGQAGDTSSNMVELIRFNHRHRAVLFLSSLRLQAPGAILSLSKRQGKTTIFLNRQLTSTEAHYRLTRLIPGLYQHSSIEHKQF